MKSQSNKHQKPSAGALSFLFGLPIFIILICLSVYQLNNALSSASCSSPGSGCGIGLLFVSPFYLIFSLLHSLILGFILGRFVYYLRQKEENPVIFKHRLPIGKLTTTIIVLALLLVDIFILLFQFDIL